MCINQQFDISFFVVVGRLVVVVVGVVLTGYSRQIVVYLVV